MKTLISFQRISLWSISKLRRSIKGGRLYPKKDKMIFAKENVVLKKIKLHASYPLLKIFPMDKRFSIWLSKPKMYFWWEGIRLQTS